MSSSLGDQLKNPAITPAINGNDVLEEEKKKNDRPSHLKRFGHGIIESGINTLDLGKMLAGILPNPSTDFEKKYPNSQFNSKNDARRSREADERIASLRKMIELPEPQSMSEKLAGSGGRALGGLLQGGSGMLVKPALRTLGNSLALGGGATVQALAEPRIEEIAPDSPYLQMALNGVLGLGGAAIGGGIGKALSGSVKKTLPTMTAGQAAPIGSEESRKLLSKQLDLAKKDPKSAAILHEIQKDQQGKINQLFEHDNLTSGEEVAEEILNNFQGLKKANNAAYDEGLANVLKNIENPPNIKFDKFTGAALGKYGNIIPEKAWYEIEKLENSSHKKMREFAKKLRKEIEDENGNPVFLNSLKRSWGKKAKYGPHHTLFAGENESEAFKKVVHGLTEDMKEQIPGYREFMKNTAEAIEHRNDLIEGVIGDYVSSAEKNPHKLIKKIFENPNTKVNAQFQEMISPELREKAAKTYLNEIFQDALKNPTWNQENMTNQYHFLRSHLQNHEKALKITLPKELQQKALDAIEKIKISERGVPRNDFTINAGRGIAVGDEVKGLGTGLGLTKKISGKLGINKLNREEMLTGISPMEQIKNDLKKAGTRAGLQGYIAQNMAQVKPIVHPQEQTQIQMPIETKPFEPDVKDFMNFASNMPAEGIAREPEENEFDVNDFMNFAQTHGKRKGK